MDKLLTTGELIDSLKVGEIAQNQEGFRVAFGRKADLYYLDENNVEDGKFVICAPHRNKDKWRILPKYVSFDEAMSAYKEGKKITIEEFTGVKRTFKKGESYDLGGLDLQEIHSNSWIIEED